MLNCFMLRRLFLPGSRCFCLIATFLGLLVSGCHRASSGAGATRIILQADWYPQPEHGGFYTAIAKGYYPDEGLDVSIQPGGPYVSVEKQVSSGAAQFGMGSSDKTLESIADSQPLVAVMATMQHDPQGIMVRKDSPIHSFADLNGHTVAIKTGSTWWEYIAKRYQLNERPRSAGDDERRELRGRSELRAAGVRDVRAVFREAGGHRDARAADERRGVQPVSRDVHDARSLGAASRDRGEIRARIAARAGGTIWPIRAPRTP